MLILLLVEGLLVADSIFGCHGDRPAWRKVTQISRIAPWANLEVRASESSGECRSVGVRHGAVAYAGSLSVAPEQESATHATRY